MHYKVLYQTPTGLRSTFLNFPYPGTGTLPTHHLMGYYAFDNAAQAARYALYENQRQFYPEPLRRFANKHSCPAVVYAVNARHAVYPPHSWQYHTKVFEGVASFQSLTVLGPLTANIE